MISQNTAYLYNGYAVYIYCESENHKAKNLRYSIINCKQLNCV